MSCFFFLTACQTRNQEKGKNVQVTSSHVDMLNPLTTYMNLKDATPAVIDTVYEKLCASLTDSNKFELLHQHVAYYKKLSGNRNKAKALIAKSEGFSYNFLSKYDSSKRFYLEAIAIYKKEKGLKDLAECYYGLAMNYFFEGNYMEALNNNYKSLAIYDQIKDSAKAFIVRTEIANNFFLQKDYDIAFNMIMTCYNYHKRHNDSALIAYNESIIGKIYYERKDYEKALEYDLKALGIRKAMGDQMALAGSYNNIATIYLVQQKWDKALEGFNTSLQLTRKFKDARQLPIIKQNIANCLWHMGRTDEAERILHEVIDSSRMKDEKFIVARGYLKLSTINNEKGNYPAALNFYEKYKLYNDSLYTYEKEKAINELQIKYETNKKEGEIIQLNIEKKVDATRKALYLSVASFILVISAFIIFFLSGRNKKNRMILEKVKLELEANTRELFHFTENAINKNNLIEELEMKLQAKGEKTTTENNKEQLSELYQLKILTEDDWQNFKKLFDKVYPGMINKLRAEYTELAPAEERQFLLAKLKIDNKECANMLGISVDSVKKNRYRLKKRFNLTERDNLDDFVKDFG